MTKHDEPKGFSLFGRRKAAPALAGRSLEELLFLAQTLPDPVQQFQALGEAEKLAPDSLEVQRRLLMLGRLHERNPKKVDYSVIKCHLLHSFEHPEKFTPDKLREMARELFDHPRLQRCMALADDKAAFLRGCLEDLSREYIRIFLAAEASHSPRVFGLSFRGSLHKYLAEPAADILTNILSSPDLDESEAVTLAKAFYRAFFEYAHGEVAALDRRLGAALCLRLR